MKKVVIDASILLTILLGNDEEKIKKIKTIFDGAKKKKTELWSISFISYEVVNGLRFSLKNPESSERIFSKFIRLPIEFFNLNNTHLKEIMSWSYKMNTTVYDTAYHFLAVMLKGTFFTCDEEYFKRAKEKGNIKLIS